MHVNKYVHTCVYKFNTKDITVNEIHEISCKTERKTCKRRKGTKLVNYSLWSIVNKDLLKVEETLELIHSQP